MSLENYLTKSNGTYEEIRWEFKSEEIHQLYGRLKEIGYREYVHFIREQLEVILKYISLSQSQRHQKKWLNHPDNLLIRFAALQMSSETLDLLTDMQPIAWIVDRGSYREFHSAIASALSQRLVRYPFLQFPFDGFENPFLNNKS